MMEAKDWGAWIEENKHRKLFEWWIWDGYNNEVGDKEAGYFFEHATYPHPLDTDSFYAEIVLDTWLDKNWPDVMEYMEEMELYVEDELGRRFKFAVKAERSVRFNTRQVDLNEEVRWDG